MVCTKAAYEQCQYNEKCWPGVRVSTNSDCAEFIVKIYLEEEEKKESENDG